MKIEWDCRNRFLNLPLQNDAEETEIRYFADNREAAVRKLPLSQSRIDSWICIDMSPFGAQETYGVEIMLENIWTRAVFAGPDNDLARLPDDRFMPILHYIPNQGNDTAIREISRREDGLWELCYCAEVLGTSQDHTDCITLLSPDQLDWKINKIEYNLNKNEQTGPEKTIFRGVVAQEYQTDFKGGELIMAVSDEVGGTLQLPLFSIPLLLGGNNLTATDSIQKLRVWERKWKDIHTADFFDNFTFRIAPGPWPNIRILEPEGKLDDISADAFEVSLDVECGFEQQLQIELCGFILDIFDNQICSNGFLLPVDHKGGSLQFTIFIDKGIAEVICGSHALLLRQNTMAIKPTDVDNTVSGNVAGCQIEMDPERGIHIQSDQKFLIRSLKVYGLRSCQYSQETQKLINAIEQDSPVFFRADTFTVYDNRVSDNNYGHPDAYVIDNTTIVSPIRVTEEFQWRDTSFGDMTRVIDRSEIWRPTFDHSPYPCLRTGIQSVDASYNVAIDIFAACKSDLYALPGQSGSWAAGLFQGPGQGFGVWVRDSAHIALRCGNLIDPEGARKTLLYTSQKGFDNGVDGPAMAIVGLWDYYLATHDRSALLEAWPQLLKNIQLAELRFSEEKQLVNAAQSTSNDAFEEPENGGYSLSTECYFMMAYSSMAHIGDLLGYDRKTVKHWHLRAGQLKQSINTMYWNDAFGYFTSGPKGSKSFTEGYWETSGAESVIWSKFGISNKQRSLSVLRRLRSVAMTDYGIKLFPYRQDKNHFCGSIWVVWEAGFADAAATHKDVELVHRLIGQQVRNCIFNKTFYEVIDANTGIAWRWPGQLWHAAGFISLCLYGLFGLRYDERGLQLKPVVPVELADIYLENLHYGRAVLDIVLEGHGTDFDLFLDGNKTKSIPWNLQGKHQVKLIMKS